MASIEPRKEYIYKYQAPPRDVEMDDATKKSYDALVSIRDAVVLITADCEISERREGSYCEKHGRPVPYGTARCDYLASRFSEGGEANTKKQVQQYVNEILGIKNPDTIKRLTG